MNTIRQISRLQQLMLVLAVFGATQSMYSDLATSYMKQPQLDVFQIHRVVSMVSSSMEYDKSAIREFISTMKEISPSTLGKCL